MDTDTYGAAQNERLVSEDGDRVTLAAPGTQLGESPDSKASTYLLARAATGWEMTSFTPQPEAGALSYIPQLLSPDLEDAGVEVGWEDSKVSQSPNVEFKLGPPGGPYTQVVTVPRSKATAWVAESSDRSKRVLRTEDHTLLGSATGTVTGSDLYEYSEGALRRANVTTAGTKIGSCGASLVRGIEGYQETEIQVDPNSVSPHAVSANGSRIFFESVPGTDCSAAPHLYLREVSGGEARTVDLGASQFVAADAAGGRVLLERAGQGAAREYLLYTVEGAKTETVLTLNIFLSALFRPVASSDLTTLYFGLQEAIAGTGAAPLPDGALAVYDLYRFDIASKSLGFVAQVGLAGGSGGGYSTNANGEDYYFTASRVEGVGGEQVNQTYRYDSREDVIQCISCASPFNTRPKLDASYLFGRVTHGDGQPSLDVASDNGDFVFFETPSALVPGDADGEVRPDASSTSTHLEFVRSPSSDTYEWRRDGVDGCGRIEGCVTLVSGGTGGYKTELIGTTPSGRDVFFATHEHLVGQDTDTSGDIYDARIGGGFAPPEAIPPGCEGDACSTPASAPVDSALGSLAYQGPGNIPAPPTPPKKVVKRCKKGKARSHGKCVIVRKKGRPLKQRALLRIQRSKKRVGQA